MRTKDIKSIAAAYKEVLLAEQKKKKLDPVDKDELEGDYDERDDKDIDNDGDTDSTDKYLHNRRKKVTKAVEKETRTEQKSRPIYNRIIEKRAEHYKNATAPEPIDSKASGKEKEFVAKHGGLQGQDSGIDGAKAAAETIAAAKAGVKSPMRRGDNPQGDKMQTPTDTTKGKAVKSS